MIKIPLCYFASMMAYIYGYNRLGSILLIAFFVLILNLIRDGHKSK